MKALERLDVVNPESEYRCEAILLKENAPIQGILEIDRDHSPQVFEHTEWCGIHEAVALTGILAEGSPDARISAAIDGEFILKDAPLGMVTPAEFPDGFISGEPGSTDLFRAETLEGVQVGFFLEKWTRVQVFASAPTSAKIMVTLRTGLYALKGPWRVPKSSDTHDSEDR